MDRAFKQASFLLLAPAALLIWSLLLPGTRQAGAVKSLVRLILLVWLSGLAVPPAPAAFSSLYVFGDGVSTTTNNTSGLSYYWGNRFCNGRVWVEVLAQRQGLPNNTITNVNWSYSSNDWSYFGHYSSLLVTDVNSFVAPTNANTALFVVWVNNADFVGDMENIYPSTDPATWSNAISSSLANHFQAITNLYSKGVRTLVMPNAVDITEVPEYSGSSDKSFIRQMVVNFNTGFASMLNQARASLPGLTIYVPDFFTLLDNMLTNAASYGLVNPGIDALEDPNLSDYSLNGPGANYLFWDDLDPTAKAHEVMADIAQQLISRVNISHLTRLTGSNRLDAADIPIGLSGFVDGRTSLVSGSWTSVTNFNSASATQSIFAPASGPPQSYRLRFPFAWSWP
jgi:outer membrane lipase/esterase